MAGGMANRRVWMTVGGILVFIVFSIGMVVHKLVSPPVLTPQQMQVQGAYMLEKPRIFSDFSLLDEEGKPFTQEAFKGKWTFVYFGFTYCPDICPTTLGVLNRFHADLENHGDASNVQVLLVSVDPERDTPEKLRDYVRYFNPAFKGVTGDFLVILKLANELNSAFVKTPGQNGNYTVDHSGNIVLINPYGHYHGFFKPPFDPDRLLRTFSAARGSFE